MDTINHPFHWLELIDRPAFCVKDGVVTATNSASENRMLRVGMDIRDIVTEHLDTYEAFQNGCLYLTITAGGIPCNASVTRTKEWDVFLIQQETDDEQLQALALAAQQLRIPLSNVMTVTDRLLASLDNNDAMIQQQSGQINHNLFQLLRIISNMSDAGNYKLASSVGMATVDITAVIDELMEKAQTMADAAGISLLYSSLDTPVFTLANEEKLERAIHNLLSNAFKFSPAGSTVEVKLIKNNNILSIAISNPTDGSDCEHNYWNRFRREPAIEDKRFGLGLGMTLVSAVASAHGGTVLIDYPESTQIRVTMTIAIVKGTQGAVHSPVLRIGDYAGGRDKRLLEFAEALPADVYKDIN